MNFMKGWKRIVQYPLFILFPFSFRTLSLSLGGWAVHLTVNRGYQRDHGLSYLGSRDVDLGFHIPEGSGLDDLRNGNFFKSIQIIKRLGYWEMGTSRFCRIIKRGSGETLDEKQAAMYPQYDLFYLFIDPLVDHPHPLIREISKIKVLDEPLLKMAISNDKMKKLDIGGREILVPSPDMLLMMKLSSFPNRTKDDKRLKDLCDIFSLIWYSEADMQEVLGTAREYSREKISMIKNQMTDDLLNKASYHLGVGMEEIESIIKRL